MSNDKPAILPCPRCGQAGHFEMWECYRAEARALRSRVAELEQKLSASSDLVAGLEKCRGMESRLRRDAAERIAQLEAQLTGAREMQRVALNFMRIPYAPSQSDFVAYRAAVDLVSRPLAALAPEAPK